MQNSRSVEDELKHNPIYKKYNSIREKRFKSTIHKLDTLDNWTTFSKKVPLNYFEQIYDNLIPLAEEGKFYCAYCLAFVSYNMLKAGVAKDTDLILLSKTAIRLGWLGIKLRLSDKAIAPLEEGLRLAEGVDDIYDERVEGLKLLANSFRNIGEYTKAVSIYQNALHLAGKFYDVETEAKILYMMGKNYCNYMNQKPRGIDYLKQAFELFCDIENKQYQAICLDEIGNAYLEMSDIYLINEEQFKKHINKVIKYHNESIRLAEEVNYLPTVSRNLGHLAAVHQKLGEYSVAIDYVKKGRDLLYKLPKERRGLGIRLGQLGELYNLTNKVPEAIRYLNRAMEINHEFNDHKNKCKNLIRLSHSYRKLKKFKKSISLLKKTTKISKRYKYLEIEKNANFELGQIFAEDLEDYDRALSYFTRAGKLIEMILDNLIKESLEFKPLPPQNDLEALYRGLLEKYHIESIKNYKQSNEIMRKAFKRLKKNQKQKLEKQQTIVKVAMRTAHKMYSPLNRVLNRLEYRGKSKDRILRMLNKLSVIFNRYISEFDVDIQRVKKFNAQLTELGTWLKNEFEQEKVLKEEIETVFDMVDQMKNQDPETGFIPRLYIDNDVNLNNILLSLFDGEKKPHDFNIKFKLDEKLPQIVGNRYKYRQMFEPIRENAIQHSKGNEIQISTKKLNDKYVRVKISDNGIGLKKTDISRIFDAGYTKARYKTSHQGLGLHIVKTLVDAYRADIRCYSKMGKGTIFSFKLPVINSGG